MTKNNEKDITSKEVKEYKKAPDKSVIPINIDHFEKAKKMHLQRCKESTLKEFLKGGKYYERYQIIKQKGQVIIDTIKYLLQFTSWTWTHLYTLVNAFFALYELALFYSKDLPKDERNEFLVGCLEFTVEIAFGKDLPDIVWDFLLRMLDQIIPISLALHGDNLENKKTPILFNGVKVLDIAKEKVK